MIKKLLIVFLIFSSCLLHSQQVLDLDTDVTEEKTFPLYRGCKETLSFEDQKTCTTKKIINFFKMSFDTELASVLFPQDKMAKVRVEFTINKKGKVEKVNAKAHKREMAVEAIKVMKRLPKLKKPGFRDGKPIDTPLNILLTIYF